MLAMMAKHVIDGIVCEPLQPHSAIIAMLGSKQLQGSGATPGLLLWQIKATTHALIQALLLLASGASTVQLVGIQTIKFWIPEPILMCMFPPVSDGSLSWGTHSHVKTKHLGYIELTDSDDDDSDTGERPKATFIDLTTD